MYHSILSPENNEIINDFITNLAASFDQIEKNSFVGFDFLKDVTAKNLYLLILFQNSQLV